MRSLVAVAVLLLCATPAAAGPLSFQGTGRIYAAVEHYETTGRVGCLVYVRTESPEIVLPILIRSADGLPCSKMYRTGRRISLAGRLMQDFPEADSLAFRLGALKPAATAKLSGVIASFEPYAINRDVQETGCEVAIDTGDPLGAWLARFNENAFPNLCAALAVGQSVKAEGRLWRTYCQGDVCEDRAHVVGAGFAWQ